MDMTAKAKKLGLTSRRNNKKPPTSDSMQPAKSKAQLRTERLAMHHKAVRMIAGLWKDREGGPVDGVEYQTQIRETW
ncbi:hypothetical protein [Duganella aceris]|uniref:Uncharacterized protein n=1 Tax=Duganella aceris TaxID=2703883 RepID=A0ABX0FNA9_9BURK|nr:hypothetical protein [Duganella aceris]NGZ86110.1 hypothetical protein [Duganella aceris]